MAEKTIYKPAGFWKFWGRVFVEAWVTSEEILGRVLTWGAIASAPVLFAILQHYNGDEESAMEESMNHWFAFIPFGLWLGWFIIHFARSPYKINRTQYGELTEIIDGKDKQIQTLQGQADEKAKIKLAKDVLGSDLLRLQIHLDEARQVSEFGFDGAIKDSQYKATEDLVSEITANLNGHLSAAEASVFVIARGPALPPAEKTIYGTHFTQGMRDWQLNINYLTAKRDALKKIVENVANH